nr:DUF6098 family protein [Rhodococcus sp. DMU2021]
MGSCAGSAGTPNSGEEHRRFAWLLHGTVADVGPDHEPLVVDVRPVARLSTDVLEQAHRCLAIGSVWGEIRCSARDSRAVRAPPRLYPFRGRAQPSTCCTRAPPAVTARRSLRVVERRTRHVVSGQRRWKRFPDTAVFSLAILIDKKGIRGVGVWGRDRSVPDAPSCSGLTDCRRPAAVPAELLPVRSIDVEPRAVGIPAGSHVATGRWTIVRVARSGRYGVESHLHRM